MIFYFGLKHLIQKPLANCWKSKRARYKLIKHKNKIIKHKNEIIKHRDELIQSLIKDRDKLAQKIKAKTETEKYRKSIKKEAYFLWQADGKPENKDDYYWNLAKDKIEKSQVNYSNEYATGITEEEKLLKEQTNKLREKINIYYTKIPSRLRGISEIQKLCLGYLLEAEKSLDSIPIKRKNIISCREALTQIEIELHRAKNAMQSFFIVAAIIYIFILIPICFDLFIPNIQSWDFLKSLKENPTAKGLNEILFLGIPMPIWVWSIIGSLASMLLRACYFPFRNINDALRWLVARPIIGTIMGVITYLILMAGLIVFVEGDPSLQTPELLWVIAFIGSFSDTLSINLLNRILGNFEVVSETTKK